MKIEIKYYVDNPEWSDGKFEDEPQRTFLIDKRILTDILRIYEQLNPNEFLHEIEIETKP